MCFFPGTKGFNKTQPNEYAYFHNYTPGLMLVSLLG